MTRLGEHGPEVVLVHRPRYGDWTLPKGKVEPGETDEACAVRELEEETGLVCELGEELGASEYVDARGRPKRVRFWAARVVAGSIRPAPPEVDEVRFVPLAQAPELLTYARDAALLEALLAGPHAGAGRDPGPGGSSG